jgi:hypothetical protein
MDGRSLELARPICELLPLVASDETVSWLYLVGLKDPDIGQLIGPTVPAIGIANSVHQVLQQVQNQDKPTSNPHRNSQTPMKAAERRAKFKRPRDQKLIVSPDRS